MFHTRKLPLLFMLLFLCGCTAAAQILYPVNHNPLKAKPGVYDLDPKHANIIFSVNHLGFSFHHGRFNTIEGTLSLNETEPEKSSVFIRIEADSIDTNSAELDKKLRAQPMLDSGNHPYIIFESTSVSMTTEKSANIEGFLTMAGRRKPFIVNATFIGSGTNPISGKQTVGFSGKGSLKRSDYGMKEWLPLIGDEVSFVIEAEFIRP